MNRAESLKESIIEAGYIYAQECFYSEEKDADALRLPDGRLDPNFLSIYDAASEILGYHPEEVIHLDTIIFPGKYDSEQMRKLIESLLEIDPEYYFIEGEKKYINEIYGENWER